MLRTRGREVDVVAVPEGEVVQLGLLALVEEVAPRVVPARVRLAPEGDHLARLDVARVLVSDDVQGGDVYERTLPLLRREAN